jgi:hypothetical protein
MRERNTNERRVFVSLKLVTEYTRTYISPYFDGKKVEAKTYCAP